MEDRSTDAVEMGELPINVRASEKSTLLAHWLLPVSPKSLKTFSMGPSSR